MIGLMAIGIRCIGQGFRGFHDLVRAILMRYVTHLNSVFMAIVMVLATVAGPGMAAPADHQVVQPRPIQLGTSGGNINDRSSSYCCSGTLGALVEDGAGTQYILSNNHVVGIFNQAVVGDPVNQPGMIDQGCAQTGIVAHFSDLVTIQTSKGRRIKYNAVDAAIAEVVPGQIATDGSILAIGPLSGKTVAPAVGQVVQKSGRTTGHTTGTVLNIDYTTSVGYSMECGGASNQVAYFNNQILIGDGNFSDSGDSGSLIVESGAADPDTGLPRAVGLLFAGSSTATVANPIGAVLSAFGVTLVGGTPVPPGPTGMIAGLVTDADTSAAIAGATVSAGGVTTTTDGAGAYVLDGVDVGTHTVAVSAIGYGDDSQSGVVVNENQTTIADFSLTASPVATLARPGCVTYNTSGGKGGTKNLQVSIKVVDDFGAPVSGAVVDIELTQNGSPHATGSGASTNSSGVVTYNLRNAADAVYSTTVTNISASGLSFSGAGDTPANSFNKGSDATPADFCNSGVSASGADTSRGKSFAAARVANARNSNRLMGMNGVSGHGVGVDENGNPVIDVHVLNNASPSARRAIPASLNGIPVRVSSTDAFIAY